MPHRKFRRQAWAVANISVERDSDGVLRRDRAFQDFRDWDPVISQLEADRNLDLTKTKVEARKITFVSKDGTLISYPTDDSGRIATEKILNTIPKDYPPQITPFRIFRSWSMGIVLAAHELNLDLEHADIQPGRITLHGPKGITRVVSVDDEERFYVDWAIRQNDPSLAKGAFEDLLRAPDERNLGAPVPNRWKDKLVVIGSTTTGHELSDVGATPLNHSTFLVTKHLNVANSVIMDRLSGRCRCG